MGSLRKKKNKHTIEGERPNRAMAAVSVPLFFGVYGFVVARSIVILIVCTERKKEREREKEKERRAKVRIHTARQYTLDNYDLWSRCMHAENTILSKDSRWSIVNNNIRKRYQTLFLFLN
jgi:hypothetical protein